MTQIERLTADVRADLAEIPGLWQSMILDTNVRDVIEGSRPAPGSRVLFDVRLWDLYHGLDVWNWCLLAIDEMSSLDEDDRIKTAPDARDPQVRDMCRFLAEQADWIITYNEDLDDKHIHTRTCGCFTADIYTLKREYAKAAGVKLEVVYHCPKDNGGCGWRVEPEDGGAWFRCTGCGKTWTFAAEIDRLVSHQDSVMTLGQIAKKTGIPHPTLRRWAGVRFTQVGVRHGRPVYDIRTVQKASERVRDTRKKAS